MNDLFNSVNARVGAPSRDYANFLLSNGRQGGFNGILHATAAGLSLPTTKLRAKILQTQRKSHRSMTTTEIAIAANSQSMLLIGRT